MIHPGVGALSENGGPAAAPPPALGAPVLALRVEVGARGGVSPALLRVDVSGFGPLALTLRVEVGAVAAPAPLTLGVAVLSGAVLGGDETAADAVSSAAVWGVVVEIDGVDRSDDLVGEVTVDAEESAARVADLALALPSGIPVSPTEWVGRRVRILFADFSSGAAVDAVPLFTGRVDVPTLAPRSGVIRLRCTDDRQGMIAALSAAQIAALLPGSRWSPAVFDPAASPWVQAGDRLSTLAAALDLDAAGFPRLTPWAARPTADFSFDDDRVLDQSVSVDLGERSRLCNRIDIDFGYRFPRLKAEGWLVSYDALADHGIPFGYWVQDGNYLLGRDAVLAALEQAGAAVVSITWIELPKHAVALPGGTNAGYWIPNPSVHDQLCLGFAAVVAFDYGQQIEERHAITVSAPASVAAVGTLRDTMSGALEGVYDDLRAAEQNVLLYRSRITTIPATDMPPVAVGLTNSVDVTLSAASGRAAADAAMETLIAVAMTKILASHRDNDVRAEIPCLPVLDLVHTVALDAQGVVARGKVRRLSHRLDVDRGRAVTAFSLAIAAAAGVGTVHPESPVAAPPGSAPAATALPSPEVTWNGLAGEDGALTITFPAVEEVERARATRAFASTYAAPLQEDLLEITP